MEVPLYFSLKKFEQNYMFDFMDVRDRNLSLMSYYDILSEKYLNVFSETNQILLDEDSLRKYLSKYSDHEGFIDFVLTNYEGYKDFLEERNPPDDVDLLPEFIDLNITDIGIGAVLEINNIHTYIISEMVKLKFSGKDNQYRRVSDKTNKINSKITNIQAIGYLFTELIDKGLIEPINKGGNLSPTNTARMILDHFHFEDLEEQPSVEYLKKTLFTDNSLSGDKTKHFKLPTLKQLNQKQ
ncbi:hypothetical protein [Elizabethkingia anophelis]|uniref:hypothetical protein n=1 Tax=Elizabethkingia anophelis TaxID=1117645 RepID=UPI0037305497